MKMDDPLRTILAQRDAPQVEEVELPADATSLHLMQAIYRSSAQPMTRRMRAAQIAIPFEHPKLSVNANANLFFASEMEEIAKRRGKSNVIDGKVRYDTSAPLKVRPPPEPIQTDPAEGGFKRKL